MHITQMDSQILSLYTKGMIAREIVATFKEMFDANISPTLISKVTDTVKSRSRSGKTDSWIRCMTSSPSIKIPRFSIAFTMILSTNMLPS